MGALSYPLTFTCHKTFFEMEKRSLLDDRQKVWMTKVKCILFVFSHEHIHTEESKLLRNSYAKLIIQLLIYKETTPYVNNQLRNCRKIQSMIFFF
jgi:hypothetical protein